MSHWVSRKVTASAPMIQSAIERGNANDAEKKETDLAKISQNAQ